MAIDVTQSGVSAGVGILDEIMEWWDEKAERTESFRTATDISRLMVAGLGYGLQAFMPRQARLGETLALSATPLLVKSVASPLRSMLAEAAPRSSQVFVPRRRVATPLAPAAPAAEVERSYVPGFNDARIL